MCINVLQTDLRSHFWFVGPTICGSQAGGLLQLPGLDVGQQLLLSLPPGLQ